KANFESAMQESQKMQGQLQSLIGKTAELAQQGNSAAKAAAEELEKRGIPIKGATAQPAKWTRFGSIQLTCHNFVSILNSHLSWRIIGGFRISSISLALVQTELRRAHPGAAKRLGADCEWKVNPHCSADRVGQNLGGVSLVH